MFLYTENDTESDKHSKNNNLQYKTHQQYKNTFPKNPIFPEKQKQQNNKYEQNETKSLKSKQTKKRNNQNIKFENYYKSDLI